MRTTKELIQMTDKARRNNEYAVLTAIRMAGFITMALLFLMLTFLSSCQEEKFEITDTSNDSLITAQTETAVLVRRVASKSGSDDDILDGSSCMSLVFPIEIVVNGKKIAIDSHEEFEELEDLIEISFEHHDSVRIAFPIKVILNDHTELNINSQAELEEYQEQCDEIEDDDIECLDFVYPITISVYNSDNQVSDVITIHDDKEFYNLFVNLESSVLLSLNYPIKLTTYDSMEITVNSNAELKSYLHEYEDACKEDDDDDHGSDDDHHDYGEFADLLAAGEWTISSYAYGLDSIFSKPLDGSVLTFSEEGKVYVKSDSHVVNGEWEIEEEDGMLELEFDFEEDSSLELLNYRWQVKSYSSEQITLLFHDEELNLKLVLTKN